MEDNIYLLKSCNCEGHTVYKLGFSADIKQRIKQYYLHNPFTELVSTYYIEEGIKFERYVHSKIKSAYFREWYKEDDLAELYKYITLAHRGEIDYTYKEKEVITDITKTLYKDSIIEEDVNIDTMITKYGGNRKAWHHLFRETSLSYKGWSFIKGYYYDRTEVNKKINEGIKKDNVEKMMRVIDSWDFNNKKLTATDLSKLTNLHRTTIQRYKEVINIIKERNEKAKDR